LAYIAIFVKHWVYVEWRISDGVIPLSVVVSVAVGGDEYVGVRVIFVIRVWALLDVRQARDDVNRDDVTAYFLGSVINCILKPFHLAAGVNSLALSCVGVLIHDQDDGASVGLNKCAGSDNLDIGDPVVVDAFYVYGALGIDTNDAYVVACDSSVGPTVNECSTLL
jgi:hypothetical protein